MLERLKQGLLAYHHRTSRLPQGQRVVASLARHLDRASSLLDVGCGDGRNTLALARAIGAETVAGVDVRVSPTAAVPVHPYDGVHLPFPDRAFEAVAIVDVLHHCSEPLAVLKEALRVSDRALVIKDHFAYGPLTHRLLYWMDLAGNAQEPIPSPGTYFEPAQWVKMVDEAGGRIAALDWPLKTHDLPWRLVGWARLQFTAKVVRAI